jgi:drug/metabolite transporter (DMT)-like permease
MWGSNGVLVNLIPLPFYIIAFFRVALGTIVISVGILLSRRTRLFKADYPIRKLFVLGVLLCLGWVLLFEAMKLLPIAEAVLLNYTAILVAILAVKQTPTIMVIVGGILVVLGGYVVTSQYALSRK